MADLTPERIEEARRIAHEVMHDESQSPGDWHEVTVFLAQAVDALLSESSEREKALLAYLDELEERDSWPTIPAIRAFLAGSPSEKPGSEETIEHREGVAEVYSHDGRYLGCIGEERWRALMDSEPCPSCGATPDGATSLNCPVCTGVVSWPGSEPWEYVEFEGKTWNRCRCCGTMELWEGGMLCATRSREDSDAD